MDLDTLPQTLILAPTTDTELQALYKRKLYKTLILLFILLRMFHTGNHGSTADFNIFFEKT